MSDYAKMQEDFKGNVELQKKFEAAKKAAIDADAKSDCEVLINAAKALGYTITEADVEKSFAAAQELSEDDLAQVSGGIDGVGVDNLGHDNFCFTAWHCYTVTLHTASTGQNVDCWKDYSCFYANNDPWSEDIIYKG